MRTVKDRRILAGCFIAFSQRRYLPAEYIVDLDAYMAILN